MPLEKKKMTAMEKAPKGRPAVHQHDLHQPHACHFSCGENMHDFADHHDCVLDLGSDHWISCDSWCANLKLVLFLIVPFGSEWSGLEGEEVQP